MENLYDINFKKVKKGYIFYSIFFIVGIVLLGAFGMVLIVENEFAKTLDESVKPTKVVIEESGTQNITYHPVYYYEVDGKSYICDHYGRSGECQPGVHDQHGKEDD